jgi:hypothetical protein
MFLPRYHIFDTSQTLISGTPSRPESVKAFPEFLDITRGYTLYTRRFNEYATQPGD